VALPAHLFHQLGDRGAFRAPQQIHHLVSTWLLNIDVSSMLAL
jgi:hypothetical protein